MAEGALNLLDLALQAVWRCGTAGRAEARLRSARRWNGVPPGALRCGGSQCVPSATVCVSGVSCVVKMRACASHGAHARID